VAELAVQGAALHLGEPEDGALVGAVAGDEGLAQGGIDGGGGTVGGEGGQFEMGHGSGNLSGEVGIAVLGGENIANKISNRKRFK
jgi:hypothetical protein